MGKRIFRISANEVLLRSESFLKREVSIVMTDGRVFLGTLIKTTTSEFYCKNTLLKDFSLQTSEIKELVYDEISNH